VRCADNPIPMMSAFVWKTDSTRGHHIQIHGARPIKSITRSRQGFPGPGAVETIMRTRLKAYNVALHVVALAVVLLLSLLPANAGCIIGGGVWGNCDAPPYQGPLDVLSTNAKWCFSTVACSSALRGRRRDERL